MEVISLEENKEAVCRRILDALPQWFAVEKAKEDYIHAARDLPMFACIAHEEVVGFTTLKPHNEYAAEIHSMGVLPQWHRRGVGRHLLRRAERYASEKGLRFLTVKTLAPSHPDERYQLTRRFYRGVGFVPLEELPDLWGSSNPCLLMIKRVGDPHPDRHKSNAMK